MYTIFLQGGLCKQKEKQYTMSMHWRYLFKKQCIEELFYFIGDIF